MADTSTPVGTWYTNDNGYPLTLNIASAGASFTGTTNGAGETLDSFSWDASTRVLQFRRIGAGWWQWYRVTIAYGVLAGRFSHSANSPSQPAISAYVYHVTGWCRQFADDATQARAWDCITNVNFRVRLAIDRRPDGSWMGTFKCYATVSGGIAGEQLEEDITGISWDGMHLTFSRPLAGQVYTATADGLRIAGTFTWQGGTYNWSGTRSEVLTHGLVPMTSALRSGWQERARGALELLMMASNPAPLTATTQTVRSNVPPIAATSYPPDRDDDPDRHPPAYTLTELSWVYALPNSYGGAAITRLSHGYLAVPNGLQDGELLPAVLAVNGHTGSAWQCFDPSSAFFWYGDGWARRRYVVLAVDVSHRNDSTLYSDSYSAGDSPSHGNGPHPSIKAPGFNSDWEEYGERTWDVMRAMDHLLSLAYVDSTRVVLTGISMGGCLAAHAGALDGRFAAVIPAGHSPDFSVEHYSSAHPCFKWTYGDQRTYIDCSDLHALIAPRPLIVQTGKQDTVYSAFSPPYAGDKQVMRRSASAYADAPSRLLHYLHYDGHHYHAGGYSLGQQPPAGFQNGVQVARVTAPTGPASTAWQSDPGTQAETLFDLVERLLG